MKKLHVCFWASLAALLMLAAVSADAADVKELFAIDLPDSPGKLTITQIAFLSV